MKTLKEWADKLEKWAMFLDAVLDAAYPVFFLTLMATFFAFCTWFLFKSL